MYFIKFKNNIKTILFFCLIIPISISILMTIIHLLLEKINFNIAFKVVATPVLSDVLIVMLIILSTLKSNDNFIKKYKIQKFDLRKVPTIIFSLISVAFISNIINNFGINNQASNIVNLEILHTKTNVFAILCGVLIIPICEEIIFRGYIFEKLRLKYNFIIAIILESLAFGIAHGNIVQGLYAFILGLLTGFLIIYTNSILSSICAHAGVNILGVFIFSLPLLQNINFNIIGVIIFSLLTLFSYKFSRSKSIKLD